MKNLEKYTPKPNGAKVGWNLKHSEYAFESPWNRLRLDTVSLPNGEDAKFSYVEHPGAVYVVPIQKDQKIILVHSYRLSTDAWGWEIPAGSLVSLKGRSHLQLAKDELEEETGAVGGSWIEMPAFWTAKGIAKIRSYYFVAKGVEISKPVQLEPGETIDSVQAFDWQEILRMIENKEIHDSESTLGLMLAKSTLFNC